MEMQKQIEQKVRSKIAVQFISLENESHMHNVPDGSESHFKMILVSDIFNAKRPVQRHQLVYGVLQEEMKKIHALAMHLYTEDEWDAKQGVSPLSPKCQGGEKR